MASSSQSFAQKLSSLACDVKLWKCSEIATAILRKIQEHAAQGYGSLTLEFDIYTGCPGIWEYPMTSLLIHTDKGVVWRVPRSGHRIAFRRCFKYEGYEVSKETNDRRLLYVFRWAAAGEVPSEKMARKSYDKMIASRANMIERLTEWIMEQSEFKAADGHRYIMLRHPEWKLRKEHPEVHIIKETYFDHLFQGEPSDFGWQDENKWALLESILVGHGLKVRRRPDAIAIGW